MAVAQMNRAALSLAPRDLDDDALARLGDPDGTAIAKLDAWWRANNYLTIGQIYLLANPLLREPLRPEHIKPRLLGHCGPART